MRAVGIDRPEPAALAELYRHLVGGEVTFVADNWVVLKPGRRLAFQQITPQRPGRRLIGRSSSTSTWRSTTSTTPSLRLAIWRRKHEIQPGEAEGDSFRVYLDPAGHRFCFCCD